MSRAPAWVDHAILWHVYPLGFLGAPPTRDPAAEPVPRLRGIVPWLDHLVRLGANVLLLGPVFSSETHGYDTTDHFTVDPRLGTEDDLDHLIAEAHVRGVRVVLDGVFNHVGRSFGPLADVLARGSDSPYSAWFRRGRDGELATFEGHGQLVALDHGEPAVADHVVAVMDHWSARGVDGWRLDAAYAVPSRFWADVAHRVTSAHPDLWLFAEVIHGDYAAVVREGGLHSVTQYELWKAIWSGLNDRNLHELAHALGRHNGFLEHFLPQTFVGNHDVTRLASRLTDPRSLPHAVAVLLTVGGVPSIYAGDDHGFRGVKEERAGGDDAVRPAFPATPEELSSLGDGVFALHQELVALRRRHPWLQRATTTAEQLTNETLLYAARGRDGERLLVALHVGDAPVRLRLPGGRWTREAGTAEVAAGGLQVPAYGWGVLAPA